MSNINQIIQLRLPLYIEVQHFIIFNIVQPLRALKYEMSLLVLNTVVCLVLMLTIDSAVAQFGFIPPFFIKPFKDIIGTIVNRQQPTNSTK